VAGEIGHEHAVPGGESRTDGNPVESRAPKPVNEQQGRPGSGYEVPERPCRRQLEAPLRKTYEPLTRRHQD
jgi:hypothetical protein